MKEQARKEPTSPNYSGKAAHTNKKKTKELPGTPSINIKNNHPVIMAHKKSKPMYFPEKKSFTARVENME